jgi:hypothetical protein
MDTIERQQCLQNITRKLVVFTGMVLILTAIGLYGKYNFVQNGDTKNSYLVLIVFAAGLLGGFVSIQQRLPKIMEDELKVLSQSWICITLIPINGGIFALVLMIMFIGSIIQGTLFPYYPNVEIHDFATFKQWITSTYPIDGTNVAKLLFWSFAAGFCERFVPQLIIKEVEKTDQKNNP